MRDEIQMRLAVLVTIVVSILPVTWETEVPWRGGNRLFGASLVAQMVNSPHAMQETWVRYLGWEDPWRRAWYPTPVFLSREFHGQRNLLGLHRVGLD